MEDSRFERNGFGGQAHGVYIGPSVETFIFRNNHVLATTGEGHGVKSRAQRTIIENNVIAGLDGRDSRAIDVPNGGEVVIRGNVLQKGPNSANAQMIGLALEGKLHEPNETLIEHNLLVFDTRPEGLIQDLARTVGLLPAGDGDRQPVPGRGHPAGQHDRRRPRDRRRDVNDRDNRTYESRRAAGLSPYPAVPKRCRDTVREPGREASGRQHGACATVMSAARCVMEETTAGVAGFDTAAPPRRNRDRSTGCAPTTISRCNWRVV